MKWFFAGFVFTTVLAVVVIFRIIRYWGNRLYEVEKKADKNRVLFETMGKYVLFITRNANIADFLDYRGFRSVAIYGMGYMGEVLYENLSSQNIEIVYVIDRNSDILCTAPIVNPEDDFPFADVIIVTVVTEYPEIKQYLENKTNIPIVSLLEIID